MSTAIDLGSIFASVAIKTDGLSAGKNAVADAVGAIKKSLGVVETASGEASTSFKANTDEIGVAADKTAIRVGTSLNKIGAALQSADAKTKTVFNSIGSRLKKLADSPEFDRVADKAAIAGAAVAAGLGAAVKGAADFDQSMRNVDSIAHLSEQGFKDLHDSVMQLAQDKSIRQGPQDLAAGLYDVYSSGFQGKAALDVLKVSAQGASAGMTDTATSSKVLMAVLNSGISGVTSTRQAMDTLFQIVNDGVLTFEELAGSIGSVLPVAQSAGISLQEVGAAAAIMTKGGVSAGQSFDDLNQFIQQMLKPSAEAAKEMDHLGIKYGMAHLQAVGLSGSLQEVIDKTQGHGDSLAKLFPNLQSFIAFLSTSKNAGKDMAAEMTSMTHAGDGVGQMMEALTRQNKGAAAQFDLLKKDVASLGVEVGETLLPIVRKLTTAVKDDVEAFNKLPQSTRETVVGITAVTAALALGVKGLIECIKFASEMKVALGILTAAEGETAAAGVLAFGPAGLLMAALAGLALELGFLVVKWGEVKQAQDDAAASAKRFANAQKDLAVNGGERGALIVNQAQIAQAKSNLDDQINAQKEIRNRIAAAKKANDNGLADNLRVEMKNSPEKYGDASPGGLQRMQNRSAGLQRDYDLEKNRLHEISQEGAGSANRALLKSGGDGFAKAVVGHAFDNISTPKNVASCALFVSEVFKAAGAKLPGGAIASAQGMRDWAVQSGAQSHSAKNALPGDLVVWHGARYGGRQTNGERSGYHVGIALGDGKIRQSSNGAIRTMNMYDAAHATAYTIPGSTFPSFGAGSGSKSGKGGAGGGSDASETSDLYSRYVLATKGRYAQKRLEAKQKYDEDRKVNAAQARAVYNKALRDIQQEESDDLKKHHAQVETQWQKHAAKVMSIVTDTLKQMKKGVAGNAASIFGSPDAAKPVTLDLGKTLGSILGHVQDNVEAIQEGPVADAADAIAVQNDETKQQEASAKELADYQKRLDHEIVAANREAWRENGDHVHDYYESLRQEARAEAAEYAKGLIDRGMNPKDARAQADALLGVRTSTLDQQEAAENKKTADEKVQPLQDAMRRGVGTMLEHWRNLRTGIASIMDDLKSTIFAAIAQIIAKWATLKILGMAKGGKPGAATGGAADIASGVAGLASAIGMGKSAGGQTPAGAPGTPGIAPQTGGALPLPGVGVTQIGGALSAAATVAGATGQGGAAGALGSAASIASLFGKGSIFSAGGIGAKLFAHGGLLTSGGALGGLGAALPWIGGGLLLNNLLGNPLKKLGKLFHFSKGGTVPGVGFRDTVPAMLTPGETVIPRGITPPYSGHMDRTPINVTHIGDINDAAGGHAVYDNLAWIIQKALPVATDS